MIAADREDSDVMRRVWPSTLRWRFESRCRSGETSDVPRTWPLLLGVLKMAACACGDGRPSET